MHNKTHIAMQNKTLIEKILRLTPMTKEALAVEMKCSRVTASKYVRELRQDGQVYIKEWRFAAANNAMSALYAWGGEDDAEVPEGKAIMGNIEGVIFKRPKAKIKIMRDWLQAAFFGEYQKEVNCGF